MQRYIVPTSCSHACSGMCQRMHHNFVLFCSILGFMLVFIIILMVSLSEELMTCVLHWLYNVVVPCWD